MFMPHISQHSQPQANCLLGAFLVTEAVFQIVFKSESMKTKRMYFNSLWTLIPDKDGGIFEQKQIFFATPIDRYVNLYFSPLHKRETVWILF